MTLDPRSDDFKLPVDAQKEVEQLAKAYTDKRHLNASYYTRVHVRTAFIEAYITGLRHALLAATEE